MQLTREPLLLFLLIGVAIFAIDRLNLGEDENFVIEITSAQQQRIVDQWQAQMGRPPTQEEANGLLDQWLREEIYYREALAMGLDGNDIIIRRRLTQKLTFLTEDLSDSQLATQLELQAFYNENLEDYREPVRVSFEHRYFSSDRRADAQHDAEAALTDPALPDDPFMLQRRYDGRSLREVGDLFGREFAASLDQLSAEDINEWRGPIRSAYGWHLIQLNAREESRLQPLEEVARKIEQDLQQQRRADANRDLYDRLRANYDVRYVVEGN